MSATVKDVAERAGVSVATVSKYMNGGNLRESYRIQVEKAVRELDYSVNEVARNLKMNRSHMVGVLVPDITSVFVTDLLKHIQAVLIEKGYIPIILDCQLSRRTEWKQLDVLLRWKVDGIVLMPGFNEKDLCRRINDMNIPLVLIDNVVYDINEDCFVMDNYDSAYELTGRMIAAGHTRIAHCRGSVGTYSADERARGYEDAMHAHGLETMSEDGFYTIEGGYKAVQKLLSAEKRPTAILSANYHMTIGVLRALTDLKLKVPKDVALATFDKQEFDFALSTSISCVVQPTEKIGKSAAEFIIKKMESPDDVLKPEVHILKAKLNITDSIVKI